MRAARLSSSSLDWDSISRRSEKRRAKAAWGTDVSEVVRVVTAYQPRLELDEEGQLTEVHTLRKRREGLEDMM